MDYKSFRIPKKNGGFREILAPSPELKEKQRKILQKLYDSGIVKKISPYAYGFIPGRSIYDNARVHAGKRFILNIDIKDFFPSCTKSKMAITSRKLVDLGLTLDEFNLLFFEKSLPQGAPTSPIVSNLFLEKVDDMLPWLLRVRVSDDIRYSRYADDITISSDSRAIFSPLCLEIIENVLKKYGEFSINRKKICRMGPSSRQKVTGLVVNSGRPTVSRQVRRRLRAAVHNIVTGKVVPSTKDLNRLKGHLAFCMQVPEHRQWAAGLMEKLGVKVNVSVVESKHLNLVNKVQKDVLDSITGNLDLSSQYPETDALKMIARTKSAPLDMRIDCLIQLANHKTDYVIRRLIHEVRLIPEFITRYASYDDKEEKVFNAVLSKTWSKLSQVKKTALLISCPELKQFVSL